MPASPTWKEGFSMGRRIIAIVGATLAIGLVGSVAPAGAAPDTLTVEGFVQDQQCQGGDFVRVTLSAVVESSSEFRARWDTTGDGRFDTPPSEDPTIDVLYPDEVNRTVTIGAKNREGDRARDTFAFATLRCEG
jgi:uncharacterized protein (DUF58 family)